MIHPAPLTSPSSALSAIEASKTEVPEMQSADFKKYAYIIVNLEMKNDFYWLIRHFDSETLDHIRSRFGKGSSIAFLQKFLHLQDEAIRLQDEGILAGSPEGLQFIKACWDMILEFTNGDATMIPKLMQMGENAELNQEWKETETSQSKCFY